MLLLVSSPASAATAPTAGEVIARHVKAVGGKDAVLAVKGIKIEGEFSIPSVGWAVPMKVMLGNPDRNMTVISAPGAGDIRSGYDGKVAWAMDPARGPQILSGRRLVQAREDADLRRRFLVYQEKDVAKMTTAERTKFDGRDCDQVEVEWKSGTKETLYFDTGTGLLAGVKKQQETDDGAMEAAVTMTDYKKIGAVSFATKVALKIAQTEILMNFQKVSMEAVPATEFELPAAIKEKLQGQPAAK